MGDFNADGFADLGVANNGTNNVFILLNDYRLAIAVAFATSATATRGLERL
jgi:hypothetical protein